MSYVRSGKDSDVYVYGGYDYLTCCCKPGFYTKSRRAMVRHLMGHRRRGDKVPDSPIERLREEIKEVGDQLGVRS